MVQSIYDRQDLPDSDSSRPCARVAEDLRRMKKPDFEEALSQIVPIQTVCSECTETPPCRRCKKRDWLRSSSLQCQSCNGSKELYICSNCKQLKCRACFGKRDRLRSP